MLIADNITKEFSGIKALDGVCMELHPGKVNAIIGENGAGKSTLMKILSGVYSDYAGRILYNNNPVRFQNPRDAQASGIAIIHQELNLIPYLTITENIFLGRELVTRFGLLDKKGMRSKTQALLNRLKLEVSPDDTISSLKVGQQQIVEIAKALLTDADVIIMDEPTSAISDSEVKVLFDIIHKLKQEHKTIVYISHKLDELFTIADRYVVLRDGKSIESGNMQGMTHSNLIQKMLGREVTLAKKVGANKQRETLLSVSHINLRHYERKDKLIIQDISFSLGKGEILGIFGLMGAGRTELLETLFGLHPSRSTGEINIEGAPIHAKSPADVIAAGMALVPEDRKKDGLVLDHSVRTNIAITSLEELQSFGLLSSKKESALATQYIRDLHIKTSSEELAAKKLSGGNQQKIVLAKWLATKPKILLLDEPTRGIDIHAKNEIYKLILQLAEQGLGIIVVSSELSEIQSISDRILVMCEGKLTAEFTSEEAIDSRILEAAIPKTN